MTTRTPRFKALWLCLLVMVCLVVGVVWQKQSLCRHLVLQPLTRDGFSFNGNGKDQDMIELQNQSRGSPGTTEDVDRQLSPDCIGKGQPSPAPPLQLNTTVGKSCCQQSLREHPAPIPRELITTSLLLPQVVHLAWCGQAAFRFKDYLSVMSVLKTFRPLKVIFHFTHQPATNDYDTWLQDLKTTVPVFEMHQLPSLNCNSADDMLNTTLGFLLPDGGIYVARNVLLSLSLQDIPLDKDPWFSVGSDKQLQFIIARNGLTQSSKKALLQEIKSGKTNGPGCVSVDDFNKKSDQHCVMAQKDFYPMDIFEAQAPFAELARWVYLDKREPAVPEQDASSLAPRISHYVRFKGYGSDFPFYHYLSVLSALYVAGMHHVYIHTDENLKGQWWNDLAKENITVVKATKPNSVFQTNLKVTQHNSDVARYLILYKYGGVYQDFDVTWTSYISDSLLSYPVVVGFDWAEQANWPETLNLGVLVSKPGAQWWHHYIQTHRNYNDRDWGYNSLKMSYKMFEKHPHLVKLDRHLQVLCYKHICHPPFEKGYVRNLGVRTPTLEFDFKDIRALHMTEPKPHPSMASPKAIKEKKDKYSDLGRLILEKSGRKHLLS